MTDEPEVITFKEFVERNPNMKEEDMLKIVLMCKNCNHKDLLKNFIREVKRAPMIWDGDVNPTKPYNPNPWKPKPSPWKIPYKRYTCKNNTNNLVLNGHRIDYEDMFFCPKCGSSLVVLCAEFRKNNILRGLK